MRHPRTCRPLRWPLLTAFGLAAAASASAQYSANAEARAGADASIVYYAPASDHPANKTASTSQPGSAASVTNSAQATLLPAGTNMSAQGSAWAAAEAQAGIIRLQATAAGAGNILPPAYTQSDSSGYAFASGAVSDQLTFNIAGVAAGSLVTIDLALRMDVIGGVTRTVAAGGWGQGLVDYQWGFQLASPGWGAGGAYASGYRSYGVDGAGNITVNTLDPGVKTFSLVVMTGQALDFNLWGWVQASGRGGFPYCPSCTAAINGDGSAFLDASHTLAWDGITGLRLGDGSAVDLSRLSIAAASGHDYTVSAVPEGGTLPLTLLGLPFLAGVARRRRRRASAPA